MSAGAAIHSEHARDAVWTVALRCARRYGATGDDAYDLAEEFLQAFFTDAQCDAELAAARNAGAWFRARFRLTALQFLERLRHLREREEGACAVPPDREPWCEPAQPECAALQHEVAEELAGAVASLPPTDRTLFTRCALEDERACDVASEAGITADAARHRLMRARRAVRRTLEARGWDYTALRQALASPPPPRSRDIARVALPTAIRVLNLRSRKSGCRPNHALPPGRI